MGNLGKSSLTKTFHIFIFGEKSVDAAEEERSGEGVVPARFMTLLLCLLLRQMVLLWSARCLSLARRARGTRFALRFANIISTVFSRAR